MDLAFNAEERAFENEVRDFIAANLTPEMKRATALTPSVFSDPDIGMALTPDELRRLLDGFRGSTSSPRQ